LILTITALLLALVTIKQLVADDSSSSDIQTFTFESSSELLNWLGSRDFDAKDKGSITIRNFEGKIAVDVVFQKQHSIPRDQDLLVVDRPLP